jgi:hypothetical protein
VSGFPGAAIAIDIHEIPRRERQFVEDADKRARRRSTYAAVVVEDCGTLDIAGSPAEPSLRESGKREVALPENDRVGTAREIEACMIAGTSCSDS